MSMASGTQIDFAAEGLLDDLEGEARDARRALLEQLSGEGVSLDELREAVAAGHLTVLPAERAIAGDGPRYTAREVAQISGVDLDLLQRLRAALGAPYGDPDEKAASTADLEAAHRTRLVLEAGFPPDELLRNARTIGMSMGRVAEANRQLVVRTIKGSGENERDFANRLAATATAMLPVGIDFLVYAFQTNLLEQVKRDVAGAATTSVASSSKRSATSPSSSGAISSPRLVNSTRSAKQIERSTAPPISPDSRSAAPTTSRLTCSSRLVWKA